MAGFKTVRISDGYQGFVSLLVYDDGNGNCSLVTKLSATPTIDIGEVQLLNGAGSATIDPASDTKIELVRALLASVGRYAAPNGKNIATGTSLDSLLSDDFGGAVINATTWDVIDGGLPAIVSGTQVAAAVLQDQPTPAFSQNAIGSGTTGITHSVAASALTVAMGTTNGAEKWFLSRQTFCGKEDILVILSKSQPIAANSIFIGLVEVDPATGIPLLNPNAPGDFTNRGGCEFGATTTTTAFTAQALGDSSASPASGVLGVAGAVLTTTQEYLIEIDSRDLIVSNAAVDSVAAKAPGASRVSTQCPNDKKLYKLVMRFRNVSAPGSGTSVVIQRVLVIDNYEQRVQVSSAEGDTNAAKGLPVNVVGTVSASATLAAGANVIGSLNFTANATANGASTNKLIALNTTNLTSVKASAGKIIGGCITNTTASALYFKLFNKASAPVLGTDTPVNTYAVPPNGSLYMADLFGVFGKSLATGIAYALTGAAADADTTAVAAGALIVNLEYV